jgi:hypothetical protein
MIEQNSFTLLFSIYNQEEVPIRKMVPFADHLYIVAKNID